MYIDIDTTIKKNICIGMVVDILIKGEIIQGCVKKIISNMDCGKGIKVELTNGLVGNIKGIPSKSDIKKETFKFYNIFFYQEYIYGIWDKKHNKFLLLDRINKVSGQLEKTMLLFSSIKIAQTKIKGTSLDNTNFEIKSIRKRNKPFNKIFKNYEVNVYSIDMNRKLSSEKINELEQYFKSF